MPSALKTQDTHSSELCARSHEGNKMVICDQQLEAEDINKKDVMSLTIATGFNQKIKIEVIEGNLLKSYIPIQDIIIMINEKINNGYIIDKESEYK